SNANSKWNPSRRYPTSKLARFLILGTFIAPVAKSYITTKRPRGVHLPTTVEATRTGKHGMASRLHQTALAVAAGKACRVSAKRTRRSCRSVLSPKRLGLQGPQESQQPV